jgi:hypothetical protein
LENQRVAVQIIPVGFVEFQPKVGSMRRNNWHVPPFLESVFGRQKLMPAGLEGLGPDGGGATTGAG